MSISKEKKLTPMFECWTADRVWMSFLFLTTWKLSHLIKTKFVENEKRVLKKKTSKKKKKRKEEEEEKEEKTCLQRDLNLCLWTQNTGKKYYNNALGHASGRWKDRLKTGTYSIKWLTVFRNKFLGFLYNYGIFNWTSLDKKLKIKSSSLEGVDWTW